MFIPIGQPFIKSKHRQGQAPTPPTLQKDAMLKNQKVEQ
jgi:hypothetical protein